MTERIFSYHGRVVHETEKAYLVALDVHTEEVWFPKSQIEYDGGHIFDIPEKIAKDKDLPKPGGSW